MKLVVDGKETVFESNENGKKALLEEIENRAEKDDRIFSHLIIDGEEHVDDYEDVIADGDCEVVEMIFMELAEYVRDVLFTIHDYIESNKQEIEALPSKLYIGKSPDVFDTLDDFIGGLEWIITMIVMIDENPDIVEKVSDREAWNLIVLKVKEIVEFLPEMESAMEARDNVLIADLINYEVNERLFEMPANIVSILSKE